MTSPPLFLFAKETDMSKFDRPTSVRLTPQMQGAVKAYAAGTPLKESDVVRMAVEHFLAPYVLRAQVNADVSGQVEALHGRIG